MTGGPSSFRPYASESSASIAVGTTAGDHSGAHDPEEVSFQEQMDDELKLSMALAAGEEGEEVVEEIVKKMRMRGTTNSIAESVLPDLAQHTSVGDKKIEALLPEGRTVNEELMRSLALSQDELKRTQMRLQIMEMIQTRMKKTATESLSVNFQLNKGSGESKGDDGVVEEEDAAPS